MIHRRSSARARAASPKPHPSQVRASGAGARPPRPSRTSAGSRRPSSPSLYLHGRAARPAGYVDPRARARLSVCSRSCQRGTISQQACDERRPRAPHDAPAREQTDREAVEWVGGELRHTFRPDVRDTAHTVMTSGVELILLQESGKWRPRNPMSIRGSRMPNFSKP